MRRNKYRKHHAVNPGKDVTAMDIFDRMIKTCQNNVKDMTIPELYLYFFLLDYKDKVENNENRKDVPLLSRSKGE